MDKLLTIEDLAERRGVSVRQARATVVTRGVPRIDLRPPGRYIAWRSTRFRREAVVAWEAAKEGETWVEPPSPAIKVKPMGGRLEIPNHLGKW